MKRRSINNSFYDSLGDRWFEDDRHAIALLRAESEVRMEYVTAHTAAGARMADIGSGAGFLAIPLHRRGRNVVMVDRSQGSLRAGLRQAGGQDAPAAVRADAFALPLSRGVFDSVMLMDVLEHVEDPGGMIREAAAVLRPGGRFFFHTFNRTILARMLAIHGMRLLMPECPADTHVYHLFITPDELTEYCEAAGLEVQHLTGVRPRLFTAAAVRSLLRRRLDPGFSFTLTRSTAVGYLGYAVKR